MRFLLCKDHQLLGRGDFAHGPFSPLTYYVWSPKIPLIKLRFDGEETAIFCRPIVCTVTSTTELRHGSFRRLRPVRYKVIYYEDRDALRQ